MNILHTAIAAAVVTILGGVVFFSIGRLLTWMLDKDAWIGGVLLVAYVFVFATMWSGQ